MAVGAAAKSEIKRIITSEEYDKIDEIVREHRAMPGSLIPVLQKVQGVCGFLPQEVQTRIAKGLKVNASEVFGVVTFYSFFTMVPKGRHLIRVCLGTACYVKGGKNILNRVIQETGVQVGETSPDLKFSVEIVRCLGACGLAPVLTVGDNVHGMMDVSKVPDVLHQYT
jgi:NADH:ubiquinone oxidoreductase subunit E